MKKVISLFVLTAILPIFLLAQDCLFIKGNTYAWQTNDLGSKGNFIVTSVSGNSFTMNQDNKTFPASGIAKFTGTTKGNVVTLKNITYKETWVGTLQNNKITGRVNSRFVFEISGKFNSIQEDAKKPVAEKIVNGGDIFYNGAKLTWSSSINQRGTMVVTSREGNSFTIDQTNVKNKSAGIVKLSGKINEDGTITITNVKWKETWRGIATGNTVTGKVNNAWKFTINGVLKAPEKKHEYNTGPIVVGKKLNWSTSAGQKGTLTIKSLENRKIVFGQINFRNRAAGEVILTGEIKEDGKFYLYNKKWNETWVGNIGQDKVSGKINNVYTFTITE